MSFFAVKNMTAGYGKKTVLHGVDLELEDGCLMGILGANGSGKTTLLKAICGILPHGGSCELEGERLEGLSPRRLAGLCGYIPQRSGISIDISALDVVLMGFNPELGLLEHPNAAMRRRACEALARVGLEGKGEENYLHLSEGQKQLCILARTLVSHRRLLLLDEPESALDFQFRHRMLELLGRWAGEGGRGALVALHDPDLALNCCDRLLLLSEGRVLGTLSPRRDSPEEMEGLLEKLYGRVSLHRCETRGGQTRLVMLKEDEK